MLVQAPSLTRPTPPAPGGARHASRPLLRQVGGTVAPLRRGRTIAVGGVGDARRVESCQLVAATDLAGTGWWVPAAAVWLDARCHENVCPPHGHPTDRPDPIGLATARTTDAATLAGLSDRLGWEAVVEFDRGGELPALTAGRSIDEAGLAPDVVVLDGRIGHEVPTVVVLGDDVVRWGAGATWAAALRRALFGRHGAGADDAAELAEVGRRLDDSGLRPVSVDIGSDALRSHGVARLSVQLLAV